MSFADDPDLVAVFRTEVDGRLASLTAGLLALEDSPRRRETVTGLFRDAHTVKGSARMLGLDVIETVAHRCEDLLGLLRDGRLPVHRDLVDLLLVACDVIGAALPGAARTVTDADVALVTAALDTAVAGRGVTVPDLDVRAVLTAGGRPAAAGAEQADAPGVDGDTRAASAAVLPGPPSPATAHRSAAAPAEPTGLTGLTGPTALVPPGRWDSPTQGRRSTEPDVRVHIAHSAAPTPAPAPAADHSAAVVEPPAAVVVEPPAAAVVEPPAAAVVAEPPAAVRVAPAKVHGLLDHVGEAELGARRLVSANAASAALVADTAQAAQTLRWALSGVDLPPAAADALHRLTSMGEQMAATSGALAELAEDHRDRLAVVRDGALGLAMVPIRRVVSGFPRLVRELARRSGKQVRLELRGEDVELDTQVLDAVADSLSHLVTNAVDHGIEAPAVRTAAGKPATATVVVTARSAGGTVTIDVSDDGRGIDPDAVRAAAARRGLDPQQPVERLLFSPGFSTRDAVTSTSGRGVGLDAVRSVVDSLGGSVTLSWVAGAGATFSVTLPVTLGVVHCLTVRVGAERYAVAVPAVVETVLLRDLPRHTVGGATVVLRQGASLPLLDLAAAVGVPGGAPTAVLVCRGGDGHQVAWSVDAVEGEAEMVVKDLGGLLAGRVPGVAGATIDADGAVVLLLDLREVGGQYLAGAAAAAPVGAPASAGGRPGEPGATPPSAARVLVVEDSLGVRELERAVLTKAGYAVETCVDGTEGAARIRSGPPVDLVVTDVEMPGCDGYALTRELRRTRGWEHVPVVIMTSCGTQEQRRQGLDAGASAYLLKHEFDQQTLIETVRRLVGR